MEPLHRRSLLAFVLVATLCATAVTQGLRQSNTEVPVAMPAQQIIDGDVRLIPPWQRGLSPADRPSGVADDDPSAGEPTEQPVPPTGPAGSGGETVAPAPVSRPPAQIPSRPRVTAPPRTDGPRRPKRPRPSPTTPRPPSTGAPSPAPQPPGPTGQPGPGPGPTQGPGKGPGPGKGSGPGKDKGPGKPPKNEPSAAPTTGSASGTTTAPDTSGSQGKGPKKSPKKPKKPGKG